MAGFTEAALQKKLSELNDSQQSIQTLSLWLIHHRKHYQVVVKTWIRELSKGDEGRRLTLLYLANDIIQNSKKKGPEYGKEFIGALRRGFSAISHAKCSEKTRKRLERLLDIWQERAIYEKKVIDDFRLLMNIKIKPDEPPSAQPPTKKIKVVLAKAKPEKSKIKEVEVEETKDLQVTLSPYSPSGDPPESEELIRALQDLENAASIDVAVREKISKLPPEVSEVKLLNKLDSREAALKLAERVNSAVELLNEYNSRLSVELEERKRVTRMLRDYTHAQKQLLSQAVTRIEEYKEKLIKVEQVRHEVLSHLNNLPDLKQLPDVTGGLAPLPSAGDLFM